MQLGERNWTEVPGLTDRPVVVPTGSLEQHGHHLPLLTDSMIGAEIARRAEAELGDAAVFLPMLWVGASHHHLHFPGTVSLNQDLYVKVLEDIVESLLLAGFRRILLLNSHAGNVTPGCLALTNVQIRRRKEMPDLFLLFTSWFDLAAKAVGEIDGVGQKSVSHACEWETSAMEAVRPELVKKAQAKAARREPTSAFFSFDYSGGSRVFVARTMEQGTASGAFGWPERATPEKGEAIYRTAVREVVSLVRDLAAWQPVGPV